MKKIHFVAIAMIAVAIGIFSFAGTDLSSYSTFADAAAQDRLVQVVGELAKDQEMYYNPTEDPNYFSFYVRDANTDVRKVIIKSEKPQDFEMSEKIVVTGRMRGEEFHATDMLLKCPSKYKDQEVYVKAEN